MNHDMRKIENWLDCNNLVVNLKLGKTEYTLYGSHKILVWLDFFPGLGVGFRVLGSRFRVLHSKSIFKESSIGHCNYLLGTLKPFKESTNHCESMVHVTQTIIT